MCSVGKGVLRDLEKFTGKHLCFNACNFIKKEAMAQVFSCEFCQISKNTFFTEHLCATTSGFRYCFRRIYIKLLTSVVEIKKQKYWQLFIISVKSKVIFRHYSQTRHWRLIALLHGFCLLKVAATDMRYLPRSKLSRSLVRKKNFTLI